MTLKDGYLVAADLESSPTYPLLEASDKGQALQALVKARTEDEVCEFTKNWGFLHHRIERGRSDRFPLALFHLHRQYFLALARLSAGLRSRAQDHNEIATALLEFKRSRAEREAYVYQRQPTSIVEDSLTEAEQTLANLGVPPLVLLQARYETKALTDRGERRSVIRLSDYAARTLTVELNGSWRLRPLKQPIRKGRYSWALEEIPIVSSLEEVLRWTIRSRYQVLHHFFCESCAGESISWRADARFCSPECGTRARVKRFRDKKRRR